MHVLVTGGGSGGHVIPTIPIMERLLANGHRVSFVGTRSGYESGLLKAVAVDYYGISAGKLRRYSSWANVRDAGRVVLGVIEALRLVRRLRPDVIFSKGGFVAFPVVLAGWMCRVPVLGHESDFSPGLANRLSQPFLRVLCTSFAQTPVHGFRGRIVHTGTPLREAMLTGDPHRARQQFRLVQEKPLLLVTGGSLGAVALNKVVRAALPALLPLFEVVHVCGPGRIEAIESAGYHQFEFINEGWGDLFALASVIVSRAGANSLFELLSLGKLNLLIPLPAAASRGDQLENADYARQQGYSLVIPESRLNETTLVAGIDELLQHRLQYEQRLAAFARVDATELLTTELLVLAGTVLSGSGRPSNQARK